MPRCVIVGGAAIGDYPLVKSRLKPDDYYIFCDSGLTHQNALKVQPDLIIGDFDSHPKPKTDIETIVLPREKDDTDTFFAVKEALRRGFKDFLLIGVIGQRLDHTLANISILLMLEKEGCSASIIDDYSEMEIISDNTAFIPDSYSYFSILAVGGEARGVYEKNVKFPLEDAAISSDYQYGVSNEVLPGEIASVSVENGRLLLVKVLKN